MKLLVWSHAPRCNARQHSVQPLSCGRRYSADWPLPTYTPPSLPPSLPRARHRRMRQRLSSRAERMPAALAAAGTHRGQKAFWLQHVAVGRRVACCAGAVAAARGRRAPYLAAPHGGGGRSRVCPLWIRRVLTLLTHSRSAVCPMHWVCWCRSTPTAYPPVLRSGGTGGSPTIHAGHCGPMHYIATAQHSTARRRR